MSCHPLPEPRGTEPDSPVGQLDRRGDSRCGDPDSSSATDGALRDCFCQSPEIPDKALAAAASVYLTLRKTLRVFSCVAGTAPWAAGAGPVGTDNKCFQDFPWISLS